MTKKVLPITYPPITTFTAYADTLAILYGHPNSYNWMYSQYILIYAIDIVNRDITTPDPFTSCFFGDFDNRKLAHTVSDFVFLKREGCPNLFTYEIPTELITSYHESFVSFIKRNIDLEMYLYTFLDASKIKSYGLNSEYSHELFIYGYDDQKHDVYFADFINNDNTNRYSFSKCSYEEIENAFANEKNLEMPLIKSVALIKYFDAESIFDYSYVKKSIHDYIYPDRKRAEDFNNFITYYYKFVNWQTKTYIGVDVYDYLSSFIDDELRLGKVRIDQRLYHAMYDHKEMMLKRIAYFLEKGYLPKEKEGFLSAYKEIRDNVLIARNYIIKYNVTQNKKILDNVKRILVETKNMEITLLKEAFDIDE